MQKKEIIQNFSHEMRLLFKIISLDSENNKKHEIKLLIEEKINWLYFLQLTQHHHLDALVRNIITDLGLKIIPNAIEKALNANIISSKSKIGIIEEELINTINILESNNIAAISFKGPALAHQLYGDGLSRFSRDLDFLVKKEDMARTLDVLENNGYTFQKKKQTAKIENAYLEYNGQYLLFTPKHKIAVEPHITFGPSNIPIHVDYNKLFNHHQKTININDNKIPIFQEEILFLVLCFHGTKEKWRRIKWLIDISFFLIKYPNINWEFILEQAQKWGILRSVYLALFLAEKIFNSPIPASISDKVRMDSALSYLTTKVLDDLENLKDKKSSIFNFSYFIFLSREKNKDKITYLFRSFFTPRDIHYNLINLPDQFFFLYYFIKVLHDYAMLPVWLIMKKIITYFKK